ncbi:hypothetical protein LWF15_30365 [Kineosporia rhizophila]|uniref:hypothetical protein n=1 Tax=Kineosporia rhizophila TaxID=84633 RepID=UPI001E2FE344|nr:hypothetical protein [Kineosporia rhizophila]MCE0539810.1 hypothetical protein [Kineosporia rhizophila]
MTTTDQDQRPAGTPKPGLPTTPLFAVVGATDLAVQQVRAAAAGASHLQQRFQSDVEKRLADVEKRVGALDPKNLRAQAEQAPTRAVARALEVAGKAEAAYEELARRGKDLFDRVYPQTEGQPLVSQTFVTQVFVSQAGSTLSRGRAAVTVARRAADDTASVIRGTLAMGRPSSTVAEPVGTTDEVVNAPVRLDEDALQKAVEVGDGGNQATPLKKPATRKTAVAKRAAAAAANGAPAATSPAVKAAKGTVAPATKVAGPANAAADDAAVKAAVKSPRTAARKTTATSTRAPRTSAKKPTA